MMTTILCVLNMLVGGQIDIGKPHAWQIGFQTPYSPVMEKLISFHNLLMGVMIFISLLVTGLLVYVIWRFRASKNPVPSKRSHNFILEVIWTSVPVLILVMIGIPSMKILYFSMKPPQEESVTVKAVGHQWYWSYEYPGTDLNYTSYMIKDADIKPGQLRLLDVDNRVVIPQGEVVRILITATDVIHSFAIPSLGIKVDAVPGKTNQTWVKVDQQGVFYGQCSELCGADHGYMPIALEVMPKEDYKKWLSSKSQPTPDLKLTKAEVKEKKAPTVNKDPQSQPIQPKKV